MDKLENISPFVLVVDPIKNLLPILKTRLPKSAHIYNMALFHQRYSSPNELGFYIWQAKKEFGNDAWIVTKYWREDFGFRYNISSPTNVQVTDKLKEIFLNCHLFEWGKSSSFVALDLPISRLIGDIIVYELGHNSTVIPMKYFTILEPHEQLFKSIGSLQPVSNNCEIKSLDVDSGLKFTLSTWKYSMKQSEPAIRKLIERNESCGIYVDNKLICAVHNNDCGLIGMLYTLPEYRRKGYGVLAEKNLILQLSSLEAIPCVTVEINNQASISFQERLGFRFSHYVDLIKAAQSNE